MTVALAAPVNIWSGSKGLAGALTNPTELAHRKRSIVQHYPVRFSYRDWPDAEAAYQTIKRERRLTDFAECMALLTHIVVAKLKQHPRLVRAITANGGVAWLETCEHRTWARTAHFQRWEGVGRKSPTIVVLINAYLEVTQ